MTLTRSNLSNTRLDNVRAGDWMAATGIAWGLRLLDTFRTFDITRAVGVLKDDFCLFQATNGDNSQ